MSSDVSPSSDGPKPAHGETGLEGVIARTARLLPAQGPISIFVHHNTLHAFEHLAFERAVVEAAELFGCEPWLPERRYREELARGRIEQADVAAVVAEALAGDAGTLLGGGFATREEIWRAMLLYAVERPSQSELDWLIAETGTLDHFREDAVPEARRRVVEGTRRSLERATPAPREERTALHALWLACLGAASRCDPVPVVEVRRVRHRDLLLDATGADSDALVHPLLVRVCAAYLDQGLGYWPMPERELGMLRCFRALYARPGGPPGRFMHTLKGLLEDEERAGLDALGSIRASLAALGVEPDEHEPFLQATLLALRGWAGMIRQVETRPDRVPVHAVPATLADFLAVRLTMERAALAGLAREHGYDVPLAGLRAELDANRQAPGPTPTRVRAFMLFQLAQVLGRSAAEVDELDASGSARVFDEIEMLSEAERRRLLQLAYERRYRIEVLDALCTHVTTPRRAPPRFQAVFCIDEREESMRRHLEEQERDCETLGTAGFFGVAMYYRGAADARPMPLCPVVIRPEVEIEEQVVEELRDQANRRARLRHAVGSMALGMSVGSRTFTRGAVLSALLGTLAAFPLVFRVLFPRSTAWLRERAARLLGPPERTRLALDRRAEHHPTLGARAGFELDEKVAIVRRLLEESGLGRAPAPLVVVVGHGSASLNNPHESAHDCGACGGGRGGPNARAFVLMANDPRVREVLAASGAAIPDSTLFVAAYHDTCDDSMSWFDLDMVPDERRAEVELARRAFDSARTHNAHERCRRFEAVPDWFPPPLALAHVEARAEDLAQTRPEYGHATNAACIVGRRERTRGLFLDRRAFLVSYDSRGDDAAATRLSSLLGAVVPVCAGISLEYWFSHVDPWGYGCHTKLPHNITSLLGVMDGHASDLRPGLPWQMVEIHEPMRLLLVVEADAEQLTAAIASSEAVARPIRNGWVRVALLDPHAQRVQMLDGATGLLTPYDPESPELPIARSSADWYGGRREHLRCARIDPEGRIPLSMLPPSW